MGAAVSGAGRSSTTWLHRPGPAIDLWIRVRMDTAAGGNYREICCAVEPFEVSGRVARTPAHVDVVGCPIGGGENDPQSWCAYS
jgi:hypothetical protein